MKNNAQQTTINGNFSQQLLSVPTKICDGIFMADQYIAQDVQWLQMNQVSHIINCAGKHCKNTNRLVGVNFLTYEWSQNNIQNIIEQNVIGAAITFIQQAKKQCGSVLVHCYQSESRPFCILASYLMIRYQWNLFKTLQYLNSRKEDIELQPAFFQQLTSLHQKLQQKGLIKSRNWNREQVNSDQQLILTNTFLNAKRKFNNNNSNNNNAQNNTNHDKKSRKSSVKSKKVNWKDQNTTIHAYLTQTIISQLNTKKYAVPNENKQIAKLHRQRNDSSYTSKSIEDENMSKPQNIQFFKQNIKQSKNSNQINVTKKWAELRQTWTKQKQNNQLLQNQNQSKPLATGICFLQF